MQSAVTRNRELVLLILALFIGASALALVAVAHNTNRISIAVPYIVVVVIAYIVAHVVMRRFAPRADPLILPLAAILNFLGLAVIYRLSPHRFGPSQVTWTLVGIALFVATVVVLKDYTILARYKYLLGFAGVALLLLPITPLGATINGARLWVRFPFAFQPGEPAKICLVLFFAGYLAERKELLAIASRRVLGIHVPDLKHFGPLLVMWGLSLAVMFYENDLGSSMLFFSIFIAMLFIATARPIYVFFGGLLFAAGAYFGYQQFGHVQERVTIWLHVFSPRLVENQSYQLAQSLFAFATGGLFGTGLGQGRPDLIPAAHTDFLFSALGEELGLLGTAAVLLCFMLLVARGFRTAMVTRDAFGQLLASGLMTIFGIQTFVIIAGVTRVLPLTGVTLPFMSYGGSSLLANFVLIGLLVRISHQTASAPDPALTGEILLGGRR
ncbi:MAG: FtsW/RodA/SpoVE family cell cycle protein [Actinomycetota bacterium]|nr:FtsW/RodA/SpoVE family cell cycle protein [Actinomycetota bacterium]